MTKRGTQEAAVIRLVFQAKSKVQMNHGSEEKINNITNSVQFNKNWFSFHKAGYVLKILTKKVFVDDDCDDIADQRKQLGEQHKNVPEKMEIFSFFLNFGLYLNVASLLSSCNLPKMLPKNESKPFSNTRNTNYTHTYMLAKKMYCIF
jgi:hypothetical protein